MRTLAETARKVQESIIAKQDAQAKKTAPKPKPAADEEVEIDLDDL
jgi:hypothetical protein